MTRAEGQVGVGGLVERGRRRRLPRSRTMWGRRLQLMPVRLLRKVPLQREARRDGDRPGGGQSPSNSDSSHKIEKWRRTGSLSRNAPSPLVTLVVAHLVPSKRGRSSLEPMADRRRARAPLRSAPRLLTGRGTRRAPPLVRDPPDQSLAKVDEWVVSVRGRKRRGR